MCSTHRDIWCPARAHQQDRDTAPPIKERIPDAPQTLKTEKCLGGGWAGGDSAGSRNGVDSAVSRNGADSAVSRNGVDSWADSGVNSVGSQNGAGSTAYSTLKAEPLKFSLCTPPVTPRGANKAYGTWRARLGLPRKRPWGRSFFVPDWRATPTKSKSSAGCTLC